MSALGLRSLPRNLSEIINLITTFKGNVKVKEKRWNPIRVKRPKAKTKKKKKKRHDKVILRSKESHFTDRIG